MSEETITNCFGHAGFKKKPTTADYFSNLLIHLSDLVFLETTAEAYTAIDNQITRAEISIRDIVADIKGQDNDKQDEPGEELRTNHPGSSSKIHKW